MARLPDFWIQVLNQFNPQEVLTGERGQKFYTDRDESPERKIRLAFQPQLTPNLPSKALLTGHRGCGKTSLLFRLLEHFKNHYFLVYFDIEHNFDKENFTQIDLLYLIGGAIYRVAEQEQLKPNSEIFTDLAHSVYTLVYEEKEKVKDESLKAIDLVKGVICFGARMLGSELGENLTKAFLEPFTFTSGVSEDKSRKREVRPQVQQVVNCVNRLIADVESKAGKQLLLVVDGLDKIRQSDLADFLFVESRSLLGPACRLIYTAPMSLYQSFPQLSQDLSNVFFLPNLKLWDRQNDSKLDPSGYNTMRQMVDRRLRNIGISDTADLIATKVLELLIANSGGVVRWLVKLFYDACIAAQEIDSDTITEQTALKAINHNSQGFQLAKDSNVLKELHQVRDHKIPSGSDLSRRLLHDQFILAYANGGDIWYDVHPLLWSALKERTVITP